MFILCFCVFFLGGVQNVKRHSLFENQTVPFIIRVIVQCPTNTGVLHNRYFELIQKYGPSQDRLGFVAYATHK